MTEPPMDSKMETLLWMIVFLGMVGFGSYIAKGAFGHSDVSRNRC